MLRLSPAEREEVEAAASLAGQSLSAWARAAILVAPRQSAEIRVVYDEPKETDG